MNTENSFEKTPKKVKRPYKTSTKQKKNERWEIVGPTYVWNADVDYRLNPEKYKVGKGEQGVLICEPYKSEILPFWHFRTPEIAKESSEKIYALFISYLENNDFIGADMSRKFIQMGYTRARRYTNHRGGRKYDKKTGKELPQAVEDPIKAESARIFYAKWREAESNSDYINLKKEWKEKYG